MSGVDGELTVFDSLAICEYVNEKLSRGDGGAGSLWPRDAKARARARSVVAEMHSGFAALRTHMPMDIRSRQAPKGVRRPSNAATWRPMSRAFNRCGANAWLKAGPMLFGSFSIADAFYAPVVTRFATYGVKLSPLLAAYSENVLALPAMQQWIAAAKAEPETIET